MSMVDSQLPTIRRATRDGVLSYQVHICTIKLLKQRADVADILDMIKELALFEKCPERVEATKESLTATLVVVSEDGAEIQGERAFARAFILLVGEQIAGLALYFYNYSTWLGTPGVYLEDLFVRPAFRRRGLATRLLQCLAQEASRISEGKGRLEWNCLRWNEGALSFYERIGGVRQEEWVGIRVEGSALMKLANGRTA